MATEDIAPAEFGHAFLLDFGQGIRDLEATILELVGFQNIPASRHTWAVNQRQCQQLLRATDALTRLRTSIEDDLLYDFWMIDLRDAALKLGQICEDISEEVLTTIFGKFCIDNNKLADTTNYINLSGRVIYV
ncbi:GTP binding domain-containing protein [Artemisia annua]|uniref:GTP binding domain-containing protein n=1 Tax=Artemisia annua TaxID=35608 RepID=A0A2U1QD29_ARTAN|nr:GTP binding domain-containing protein [Artemisia annua]